MAYSVNKYLGDGANKLFPITFPYQSKNRVNVRVGGVSQTLNVDYSFISPTSISFTNAPAQGVRVDIRRNTPKDKRVVEYQDATILTEAMLNSDADQLLFIMQETSDLAQEAVSASPEGLLELAESAKNAADSVVGMAGEALQAAGEAKVIAIEARDTANGLDARVTRAQATADEALAQGEGGGGVGLSDALPSANGVPTAGVATEASRADHVHPPTAVARSTTNHQLIKNLTYRDGSGSSVTTPQHGAADAPVGAHAMMMLWMGSDPKGRFRSVVRPGEVLEGFTLSSLEYKDVARCLYHCGIPIDGNYAQDLNLVASNYQPAWGQWQCCSLIMLPPGGSAASQWCIGLWEKVSDNKPPAPAGYTA
jgi:hypothetical protein